MIKKNLMLLFTVVLTTFLTGCIWNPVCCVAPPSALTLSNNGDCTFVDSYNEEICLHLAKTTEGWVNSKLIISRSNHVVVETQTYLTSATITFSPNKAIFVIEVSSEGHPSFGLYDTKRAISGKNEPKADVYIDEYYFDHFEEISDNGDVIFALSEYNGLSCYQQESEENGTVQKHNINCLSGFNVFSKRKIKFESERFCRHF